MRREIVEGIKSVLQNKGTKEFTSLSNTMVLIDKSTLPALQVTGIVINCKLILNTKRSSGIGWIMVVVSKNVTSRIYHKVFTILFFHVAPNPCSSGYMNYCDRNAECRPTTRSFICQCKDGYTDVSFNKLETPGERCKRKFYTFI